MNSRAELPDGDARPLVSVVIPTYGRSEYLPRAIRSVTEQTYDNIELFVVDDGSPTPVTETLSEIDRGKLRDVTFIRHDENRGANVARNTGIRAAKGEYIAFLDDDDQWSEAKIFRQVEAFQSDGPETGVVYTGVRKEGPTGTVITTPEAEGEVVKDLLTGETFGQFSSVMVSSRAIDAAGLPDARFPAWQDRDWFLRLAQHCHFKGVHDVLTYRQTGLPDSITKKYEEKRDVAYPLLVKKHTDLAEEHGLYYRQTFFAWMYKVLARSAARAERYREARKYFLLAFLSNPLYRPVHAHLIASLGGKWTYETAAFLRRKTIAAQSLFR